MSYSYHVLSEIVLVSILCIDSDVYQKRAADHRMAGRMGSFSSSESPVNIISGDKVYQRWHIRVPVGEKLELSWTYSLIVGSALEVGISDIQMYVGYSCFTDSAKVWKY